MFLTCVVHHCPTVSRHLITIPEWPTKSNGGVVTTQERSNKALTHSKICKMIDIYWIENEKDLSGATVTLLVLEISHFCHEPSVNTQYLAYCVCSCFS